MLKKEEKAKLLKEFQVHEGDTGSTEAQLGLLNSTIEKLASHLKTHPKDKHSKRGLLKLLAKRRKFLKHLKRQDPEQHKLVADKLGLKK